MTSSQTVYQPGPFAYAAWITSAVTLSILLNLSLTLEQNPFFFVAHTAAPWNVAILLILVILLLAFLLWVLFFAVGRLFRDIAQGALAAILAWFILVLIMANFVWRNEPVLKALSANRSWPTVALMAMVLAAVTMAAVLAGLKALSYPTLTGSIRNPLSKFSSRSARLILVGCWLLASVALFLASNAGSTSLANPLVMGAVAISSASIVLMVVQRAKIAVASLVISAAVAVTPLLLLQLEYRQADNPLPVGLATPSSTPDVLWVVVDELQYPVLFDDEGRVREIFPSLRSFQEEATTYVDAYTPATFTDVAMPALLTGTVDLNEKSDDAIRKMQRDRTLWELLRDDYVLATFSQWFNGADRELIVSAGEGLNLNQEDLNPLETRDIQTDSRLALLAADTAAVLGATALAPPVTGLFPSLEGKWTNFWSPTESSTASFGIKALEAQLYGVSRPLFAFWHYMQVHVPQTVDYEGIPLPRFDIGANEAGASASRSLIDLHRRLYLAEVIKMDSDFGRVLKAAKSRNNSDGLLVIFTADHGRTFTTGDVRYGDNATQAWGEVAHVPLIVKYPFQELPTTTTDIRSIGQVVPTILETLGIIPPDGFAQSPSLTDALNLPPVPLGWDPSSRESWCASDCQRDSDLFWDSGTLVASRYSNPWAVGIDAARLGTQVTEEEPQIEVRNVEITASEQGETTHVTLTSASSCASSGTPGLIVEDGQTIGTILWEGVDSAGAEVRGWGLLPEPVDESDVYFYCST